NADTKYVTLTVKDADGDTNSNEQSFAVTAAAAPTPTPTPSPTPAPSTNGLVASYGFDAGSGTTVKDSTGHGHTGTLSGATWSAGGRHGKSLNFNGTN